MMIIKLLYFSTIFAELNCLEIKNGNTKSVTIAAFQPQTWHQRSKFDGITNTDDYLKTKAFSVCFRYMTRFISDNHITLLDTHQMTFAIGKNFPFVLLRPWNASSLHDEYCRILKYCQFYKAGHWVSVCLKVKLDGRSQELTFIQDGDLCFKKTFDDGSFEWLFFREMTSIKDILR